MVPPSAWGTAVTPLQRSDGNWVHAAGVKNQMKRMDPVFNEKSLGFTTFREFVESRSDQVVSKAGTKNSWRCGWPELPLRPGWVHFQGAPLRRDPGRPFKARERLRSIRPQTMH